MFDPPFFVISIPLDEEGRGPEMDNPVRTVWEVWDACCRTLCEADSEFMATVNLHYIKEYYV